MATATRPRSPIRLVNFSTATREERLRPRFTLTTMPRYLFKALALHLAFALLAVHRVLSSVLSGKQATANEAVAALRDRGVAEHALAEFETADPRTVMETCIWFDEQRGRIGVGAFLLELRGRLSQRRRLSTLDAEKEYGNQIRAWLLAKLPDVCKPDDRLVEWERRLYGEDAARGLAAASEPHPAAVGAVIRLHHRYGKGQLTVREHGPMIRAAVRAHNDQAIRDYEAIAAKRDREASRKAAFATSAGTGEGER